MHYKIAVLSGDGIGPEVMSEALKVLHAVGEKRKLAFDFTDGLIGGIAIDEQGTPLPEETVSLCKASDAVLLGSIGGPKWDSLPPEKRPELGGLLAIRKSLKLYANIRPVKVYNEVKDLCPLSSSRMGDGIDILTVRELSGGIYFGKPKKVDELSGMDTMIYSSDEVERIARVGFEAAMNRHKRLTSVDKANVLHTSILWRKTVERVAEDYPEVKLNHMYVDNAAMQLILNPAQFDVILTGNLFGDILSDESAALAGSLGMLPSASLGANISLYEPSGGSAPDIAGKGIANPIAQILSAAMMLEFSFKNLEAARDIYNAVEKVIASGVRTADISGGEDKSVSTSEMGDAIVKALRS